IKYHLVERLRTVAREARHLVHRHRRGPHLETQTMHDEAFDGKRRVEVRERVVPQPSNATFCPDAGRDDLDELVVKLEEIMVILLEHVVLDRLALVSASVFRP